MSETKFTPGPWQISPWNSCVLLVGHGDNRTELARVKPRSSVDFPEAAATARLISTAPELYAALESLLSGGLDVSHTALFLSRDSDKAENIVQLARKVLAKANGEAI